MKEGCSSCLQMKAENKLLRKSLLDNNKNYVEVCNENLELRRKIEDLETRNAEKRAL